MRVASALVGLFFSFSFGLERFFPQFVKLFLSMKLGEYEKKGVITGYRVKARRKRRYHYTLEVDLYLRTKSGGEKHG